MEDRDAIGRVGTLNFRMIAQLSFNCTQIPSQDAAEAN